MWSNLRDLLGFAGEPDYLPRRYLRIFSDNPVTVGSVINSLSSSTRIGSLELPIDYEDYHQGHVSNNVFWLSPFTEIEDLRSWVGSDNIVTKIQVKAYLTDRRQTGDYQTNREIRWEGHPDSP